MSSFSRRTMLHGVSVLSSEVDDDDDDDDDE
jgi:hypothetical protein